MVADWKTKYQYQDDVWDALEGTISGLALSLVSGFLLYLAFPPVSVWPLAWIALVPMLRAQYQTFPDELSWMAVPMTTVTFLTVHFNKVDVGFALGSDTFPPLVKFLLKSKATILATVFVALALLSVAARRFQKRSGWRYQVLEPVVFWMALDYLRDSVPVLGTSASFAYSQFKVHFIARTASLVGTFGVTGMIVAVNAALTALLLASRRDDRGYLWKRRAPAEVKALLQKQAKIALAVVGCLLLLSLLVGIVPAQREKRATVGLVQPGRKMTFEYDKGLYTLRLLTTEASERGAKIVVWPEASFRDDPRTQSIWTEICSIARDTNCYLVVPYFTEAPGTPVDRPDGVPQFINEGLLLAPDGQVLGAGAKDHPVALLGETSASRGKYPVFDTPFGKVGIMICYDLNFTDTARRLARSGAEILCVPSNDWKAISQAQYMYAVFRAAENGLVALKADSNYDSCIVTPDGLIVRKAVNYAGETAVLVADVPLRKSLPPAAYLGNTAGLLSLVLWAGSMVWAFRRRPR